jgi:hypothetical protein
LLGFYAEAHVLADRRPKDSTSLFENGSLESSGKRLLRRLAGAPPLRHDAVIT